MIQDIAPKRLINAFDKEAEPKADDKVVIARNGLLLLKANETDREIIFPTVGQIPSEDYVYLFSVDNERFFILFGDREVTIPEGFEFLDIRKIRKWDLKPRHLVFAAFTAHHLANWYSSNRFCGTCATRLVPDKTERALYCGCCNKKIYPRINPAVIIGVKNGDRILITKYRTGFAHNALVAGFTEIGETLEETVQREVMEEVGLKVKNISYYKSQPWGIADDLLVGYYCDVDGDDDISMDESELKYAEWVRREDIVLQPLDYSLTNEMMKRFKDGLI